jgi:hypothetical protein
LSFHIASASQPITNPTTIIATTRIRISIQFSFQ